MIRAKNRRVASVVTTRPGSKAIESSGPPKTTRPRRTMSRGVVSGRYLTRTSDLHDVNVAL